MKQLESNIKNFIPQKWEFEAKPAVLPGLCK